MGKTILELFREKPIAANGSTAEQYYDVRNSKDLPIKASSTLNGVLIDSTGFQLARNLRKTLGVRLSETFLESESIGLRIIQNAATPVIYGNEASRILLKTTPTIDLMKSNVGVDRGIVGNILADVRNVVTSKLGIPEILIPTRVSLADALNRKGETQNRMIDLAEIRKSGDGSIVGKFLKEAGGGTPESIVRGIVGNLIESASDAIRGKLFGDRSTTPFNIAGTSTNGKNTSYNYGSIDNSVGITFVTNSNSVTDVKGVMYSKTFNFSGTSASDGVRFISDVNELEGGLAVKTPNVVKSKFDTPTLNGLPASDTSTIKYSSLFTARQNNVSDAIDTNGNIKPNENATFPTIDEAKNEGEGDSILLGDNGYSAKSDKLEFTIDRNRISENPDRVPKYISSRFGIETKKDIINQQSVYDGETLDINGKTLDDYDLVPLKFYSIHQNKTVQFRSTITGLSETLSPNWSPNKFGGSPFSYHTYSSIDRTLSFSFKVFPLSAKDHVNNWKKLNYLSSMVYPQGYYENSAIVPPFIKFTLGVMYYAKFSFINSLSYTFDETGGWHIDDTDSDFDGNDFDTKYYKLPRVIDVNVGITLIESRGNTEGRKYYSFNPNIS